jgi:hypothetical protein
MNDPLATAIAWGILAGLGALATALLNKLKLRTKNVYVLSMVPWVIGFGCYVTAENFLDKQSVLWTFLFWAGFGFMGIGASVFIFNMLTGKLLGQPKHKETPIEASFGYRIGRRLGMWYRKDRG